MLVKVACFVGGGANMTQKVREQRIHYKLDQDTPVIQYEMKAYNVPFAGNTSSCRETYVKGDRVLEFNVIGDMTFEQLLSKPVFRDELVEYLFSISKQLVSIVQNGLNLNKVVLDLKFIYARLSDFTVQLIYLPLDTNFPEQNVGEFMRGMLSKLVYAHTPAIECANQIVDYFDDHRTFDVYQFNNYIRELRASSQLLIIQEEIKRNTYRPDTAQDEISARYMAEVAMRDAEKARVFAENEAKRQEEEARHQAEIARKAEEARMRAEAARIEAEVARQKAEEEVRQQAQTTVLYAREFEKHQETEARKQAELAKLRAEEALRVAKEQRSVAEKASSMYADEIRRAKETAMKAEEARIRAELEAKRQAEEARRMAEEAGRLNEGRANSYRSTTGQVITGSITSRRTAELGSDAGNSYRQGGYSNSSYSPEADSVTTVLSGGDSINSGSPVIIRKSTGEVIEINKQVFCIGKADRGVDYKITGNKSISRRHAYITSINGVNYLRDNNSTNHTYLNGSQVYSNMDVVITDNSLIRFSNEEFIFKANK